MGSAVTVDPDYEAEEIYVDETGVSGDRFMVLGGIVLPAKYSAQFERAIVEARSSDLPTQDGKGEPVEIGWNSFKPSRRSLAAYKRIVDTFFSFKKVIHDRQNLLRSPDDDILIFASVIDTHVKGRHYSVGALGQLGFDQEIYFHCLRIIQHDAYLRRLFHVYLDERTRKNPLEQLVGFLRMGFGKRRPNDPRRIPVTRARFLKSQESQAIQVSDLFIGAMQYRLNGYYDGLNPKVKDPPNPVKKELCEYILQTRSRIWPCCEFGQPADRDWGRVKIWVRKHRRALT